MLNFELGCFWVLNFVNLVVFLNFAFMIYDPPTRSDPLTRDTTRHGLGLKISTQLVKRVVSGLMISDPPTVTRQPEHNTVATPTSGEHTLL